MAICEVPSQVLFEELEADATLLLRTIGLLTNVAVVFVRYHRLIHCKFKNDNADLLFCAIRELARD